jgi:hypothetical protein
MLNSFVVILDMALSLARALWQPFPSGCLLCFTNCSMVPLRRIGVKDPRLDHVFEFDAVVITNCASTRPAINIIRDFEVTQLEPKYHGTLSSLGSGRGSHISCVHFRRLRSGLQIKLTFARE